MSFFLLFFFSDFTDYREYVECFNHLPPGRWRIKLENCSSFTGTYLNYNYRKYDTTNPDGMVYIYGVDSFAKNSLKGLSGEQKQENIWTNFRNWDSTDSTITFETSLTRSFLLYMRPNGSNCKWQVIGFSASGRRVLTLNNNEYANLNIITLNNVNNTGDLNVHLTNIYNINFNTTYESSIPNKTYSILTRNGSTDLINRNGSIVEFENPYTGNISKVKVEVSRVNKLVTDTKGNRDILEYLKLNPIAYSDNNTFYGNTIAYQYSAPSGTASNISRYLVGISNTYSNQVTLTIIDVDPFIIYRIADVTTSYPERRGNINIKKISNSIYLHLFNAFNETDKVIYTDTDGNSLTIQRG